MRTAYIAGPMRGLPQFNFPAFFAAEDMLRGLGWNVLNPARMDQEQDGFDQQGGSNILPVDHYIRRDFEAIMSLSRDTDKLVALRGWERSVGARAEVALAEWRGIAVELEADIIAEGTGDAKGQVQTVRTAAKGTAGIQTGAGAVLVLHQGNPGQDSQEGT